MTGWRGAGLLAAFGWVAVAHLGPLWSLLRISLLDRYPVPPGVEPGWSGAAYAAVLADPGTVRVLGRSLLLAAVATLLSVSLAFPLAAHVALRVAPRRRARRLLLLAAPFWTGEVLRIVALQLLLARRGALNEALGWAGWTGAPLGLLYGDGAVLAGLVYTVLLAALLPLYAALDRLPPGVLDAAADLGAGPWRRLWAVTLPLAAPGVGASVALTFLASLGVFAAPALLGGPSSATAAGTVADLFGAASGRWPEGAALGLVLLLAGTAGAAALAALVPGIWRRAG